MDTVLKFYLKSSDANERQAVEILDKLMEESREGTEARVGRQVVEGYDNQSALSKEADIPNLIINTKTHLLNH